MAGKRHPLPKETRTKCSDNDDISISFFPSHNPTYIFLPLNNLAC